MKKMISYQLRYMFRSPGFLIAFCAVLGLCLFHTLNLAWSCRGINELYVPYPGNAFILRGGEGANEYLKMLYIFILVFPFGFIEYKYNKLNITPVFKSRSSVRDYYISSSLCAL